MLLIARWLVKLIPFSDFDYLIPLGYKNQENCKIAGKIFKIKYHVTHCIYIFIYNVWNVLCDFDACDFIYIPSNSKLYIFQTVCALDFLFSALYTTPFLYAKLHFGVLHLLRVSIATSDTPPGSNPP